MASIRARGKRWQAIVRKRGVHQSESFATKTAALRWAAAKELEIEEGRFSKTKGKNKTVRDALDEYSARVSIHKAGKSWERRRLKWFGNTFLGDLLLDEIDASHVARFRDERLLEVSGSTVNRDFNLLSHVFTTCVDEWLWMEKNPCSKLRRPPENPPRERRISDEEIETMRLVLDYPEDTVPATQRHLTANLWLTSIETAMRLSEVNSVTDDSFHETEGYVRLDKAKNGKRRNASCTKRAVKLIKLRLQSEVRGTSDNLSKCFENAVKRSAIKDLTYHDSRHEGITRLAQKLHVLDLARTVGITNIKQLMTYYDATPGEIAAKLD